MASDDIIEIFEIGLVLRLKDSGLVDENKAAKIVGEYFQEARESYGGVRYMIKRGYRRYPPETIVKIKREYNGRNGEVLRLKYGMSRSHFYRTVAK